MTAKIPPARPTRRQPLRAGEQNRKHSKAVPRVPASTLAALSRERSGSFRRGRAEAGGEGGGGVRDGFLGMAACVLVALNSGCISTEKTEYRDPERLKVDFENDTAGRQFYEALSQLESRHHRSESKTELSIPVVFKHKHRIVEGENVVFNDAVRRCDTNGDGKITELEARIFSEAATKRL